MKKLKQTETIDSDTLKRLDPFFPTGRKLNLSKVDTVVLHWTGGSTLQPAIDTLKQNGFGYHFLIDKDGTIIQGAKLTDRMSHAGESYGPNGEHVNNYAIGISFVHWIETDKDGIPIPNGKEDVWTDEQQDSVTRLIYELKEVEGLNLKYLTGHHEISPGRKYDPYSYPFNDLVGSTGLKYWKAGDYPYTELDKSNGSDARRIKQFDPTLKTRALRDLRITSDDKRSE